MRRIRVIIHNVRSTHNVGSFLRTADCLGIEKVYMTGYTPYPQQPGDPRLPHVHKRLNTQIAKTSLGAETTVAWEYSEDVAKTIDYHRDAGYRITCLEQVQGSTLLPQYKPSEKEVLIVGNEVDGVPSDVIKLCDEAIEIPQYGQKESFNVAQAAAIALYSLREA